MEMEQDSSEAAQLDFERRQAKMEENFKTFGEEVSWDKVPELVRAGREVWSFGYGRMQIDMEDDFTTIDEDDLEIFKMGEAYVSEWAPFRVAPLPKLTQADGDAAANMIAELEVMGYIIIAIAPDDPFCPEIRAEHWISNLDSGADPICGRDGMEFEINS